MKYQSVVCFQLYLNAFPDYQIELRSDRIIGTNNSLQSHQIRFYRRFFLLRHKRHWLSSGRGRIQKVFKIAGRMLSWGEGVIENKEKMPMP